MARMTRKFYARPGEAAKARHELDVNIVPALSRLLDDQRTAAHPVSLRLYTSTGLSILRVDEFEARKVRDFLNRAIDALWGNAPTPDARETLLDAETTEVEE